MVWSRHYYKFKIPPIYSVFCKEGNTLVISNTNFEIPTADNAVYIADAFREVVQIASIGGKYVPSSAHDRIELDGQLFNIYNAQSIRIISEVYVNRIYDVAFPGSPVVIDIGMNVGISSLFFSKYLNCPVYGYEPFEDTYKMALANFKLNPDHAGTIYPFKYAIGSSEREEEFIYCPNSPGDCGVVPIPEAYSQNRPVQKEKIKVISIDDVVRDVLAREPDRAIILKLDCEGMEYEIIRRLDETGLIFKVRSIIMEWHRRGGLGDPSDIQKVLARSGFITFGNAVAQSEVGMLYSVNVSRGTIVS